MKAVLVEHTGNGKPYCFSLPDWFDKDVPLGTNVVCRTRRGITRGMTVSNVYEGDFAREAAIYNGAKFPLAKIEQVQLCVKPDDIVVPGIFKNSNPSARKLQRRRDEHAKYGKFLTPVVVSRRGVLQDGYTAYLVAKELGIDFTAWWEL